MRVVIHEAGRPGAIVDDDWRVLCTTGRGFVRLRPGRTYWLRLYRRDGDPMTSALVPADPPNLAVLQLRRGPAVPGLEPAPSPFSHAGAETGNGGAASGETLLQRVQFRVDNDGVTAKIIRWSFREDGPNGESASWRLPLRVGPTWMRQGVAAVGFGVTVAFTTGFQHVVDSGAAWSWDFNYAARLVAIGAASVVLGWSVLVGISVGLVDSLFARETDT